jgi:hypothetical protein
MHGTKFYSDDKGLQMGGICFVCLFVNVRDISISSCAWYISAYKRPIQRLMYTVQLIIESNNFISV